MEPDPSAVPAGGRSDRLSRLGDGALGHVLSFLPAAEAARAAALSRRWRHVFASVHTVSFKESNSKRKRPVHDEEDDDSGCSSSSDDDDGGRRSTSAGSPATSDSDSDSDSDSHSDRDSTLALPFPFADSVSAALHGRHRGSHVAGAPLRGLRVEFDGREAAAASAATVDGWLYYAVHQAGDELHVDLRLGQRQPICTRLYALRRGDGATPLRPRHFTPEPCRPPYVLPRSLFRCAALRSLRLSSCRLDPPAAIAMPSLDTLHLTHVTDRTGAVQRLVSACPCLADLTLEACCGLTELSVLSALLRRLALRCCHDLATVAVDSSELRAFEYSGAMPGPSFMTVHGPRRISSCMLNFCGEEATDLTELASLRDFLQLFAGVTNLQLKSARLGSGAFSSALEEWPGFAALRHIELTGMLPEDDDATVAAVARMLERTPSLETLSLFFMPEPERHDHSCCHEDQLRASHKLRYSRYVTLAVPESAGVGCLRERTREINFVHYQGGMAQRMLAKFLLCNAQVVNEVYCEFARGPLFIQTKLMEEINGWVQNKSANMMFF